jgi:hypothetical protein
MNCKCKGHARVRARRVVSAQVVWLANVLVADRCIVRRSPMSVCRMMPMMQASWFPPVGELAGNAQP